jgi:hypothetical protein
VGERFKPRNLESFNLVTQEYDRDKIVQQITPTTSKNQRTQREKRRLEGHPCRGWTAGHAHCEQRGSKQRDEDQAQSPCSGRATKTSGTEAIIKPVAKWLTSALEHQISREFTQAMLYWAGPLALVGKHPADERTTVRCSWTQRTVGGATKKLV